MIDPDHPSFYDERSKIGALRRACRDVMLDHEVNGALPTSVTFVFYELEQSEVIPKAYLDGSGNKRARTPRQDVSDALTDLREHGVIPWDWVVDEGRSLTEWEYHETVRDYLREQAEHARIDAWAGAPPPLIITESRSLAGVLRNTASAYLCPIVATAGQSSGSLIVLELAPLLREDPARPVIYLGDFDFAGGTIENSTRARLEEHVGAKLRWVKLAVTRDQIRDHKLPVIQKVDRRHRPHRAYDAVETEALGQEVIVGMLVEHLDALVPEPLAHVRVREQQQREQAERELADGWSEDGGQL